MQVTLKYNIILYDEPKPNLKYGFILQKSEQIAIKIPNAHVIRFRNLIFKLIGFLRHNAIETSCKQDCLAVMYPLTIN